MGEALSYQFLGAKGKALPPGGGSLHRLTKIEAPWAFHLPEITVACDVKNPLYGKKGAAYIYSSQKGVTPIMVQKLDDGLRQLAKVCGREEAREEGAGAAGGMAYGLKRRIKEAYLVITGEGAFDSQSGSGKAPMGVMELASKFKKAGVVFAGKVEKARKASSSSKEVFTVVESSPRWLSEEEVTSQAGENLERTAALFAAGFKQSL